MVYISRWTHHECCRCVWHRCSVIFSTRNFHTSRKFSCAFDVDVEHGFSTPSFFNQFDSSRFFVRTLQRRCCTVSPFSSFFFFFSFSLPNFPHRYDISALFNQLPWFFSCESLINPRKTSPTRAITVFFNIFQCFELKRTTFNIFSIERKNRTCKASGSVCVLEGLKYSERQAMENFAIIWFPNKRSLMKRLRDAYPRNVSKRRVYSSTWLPL